MDELTKAYIAGFLDGDGSIICQLVRCRGYRFGFYVRVSICFYQSTINRSYLKWLKDILVSGYIRDRAGKMSDYTIVGRKDVRYILKELQPYLRLKARHAIMALEILDKLERKLDVQEFLAVAGKVDEFSTLNYSKKKVHNANSVRLFLESMGFLAPVTTDSLKIRDEMAVYAV